MNLFNAVRCTIYARWMAQKVIDEARYAGLSKYNKGRMLTGVSPPNESSPENVKKKRNHGRRIDGLWVFWLIKVEDLRCFYVQKRDAKTLLEIIKREVTNGSTIHSNEHGPHIDSYQN